MSPEGYTARTAPEPDDGCRRLWGSSLLAVVESKRTRTSNFGSSRRESHDATAFYDRFEPPTIRQDRDVNWHKAIDHIYLGDARQMTEVPSNSVALVVTSPPYFAGKEYEEDMGRGHVPASYRAYLQVLEEVFAECVRTLEPGGRMAVNVANLGRRPYRSLSGDVIRSSSVSGCSYAEKSSGSRPGEHRGPPPGGRSSDPPTRFCVT
jgi:hypothetical protein